jgi:hypothetical protein
VLIIGTDTAGEETDLSKHARNARLQKAFHTLRDIDHLRN